MAKRFPIAVLIGLVAILVVLPTQLPAADEKTEFFEKRIRPILVDHCYECHGPDEASGQLRLDSKSGWKRGGKSGPAIVPGNPSASLLVQAVSYTDDKRKMPPADSDGRLNDRQIADLVHWIRTGATDPRTGNVVTAIEIAGSSHWAFQPVVRPKIKSNQHPIDFLIARKLRQNDFRATKPADTKTLIRRATFDLLGLPPSAEQLETSQQQFAALVKRLLDSPHYGERWGRHWLDVARYSDAKDGVLMYGDARIRPFAYTYRDYVIRAFNEDKPFDQFIREQLAADQMGLADDSPDLAAMGLLTLGRLFDRNRHDVIDDQIDVVSRGFLGLTVSCARCHDHKFDPVPTADYYSLYGVFASCREPLNRPRISEVQTAGQAFEKEFDEKLKEVLSVRQSHYEDTLNVARDRTADYLVQVATTEPDLAETTIFFLSLIPDQLRPQFTWRWRQLIAKRAFPDDPVFGPWHDLMRDAKLRPDEWRKRGVNERIIAGLVTAAPKTPAQIARTFGKIISQDWIKRRQWQQEITSVESELSTLDGGAINISDIVAGGNGYGTGTKGHGIHPATGAPTTDGAGFVPIKRHGHLIPVTSSEFVDGVFVPKTNTATISTTGLNVNDIPPSTGMTWDYFKYGPSGGSSSDVIDGINYNNEPNRVLSLHANKGITFDVQAMRTAYEFGVSRFTTVFGHAGAKDKSQLDFCVYLDGKKVLEARNFKAQQKGLPVDIEIPPTVRFITLVVTEGAQGISHDQAILGNPRIVPDKTQASSTRKTQRLAKLKQRIADLQDKLKSTSPEDDPLSSLLVSRDGPIWFPIEDASRYLHRQKADAFRGLVGQLDAISVKHKTAAGRAMVMNDADVLCDPVIFQRGDPGNRGTHVPRRFLKVLSKPQRTAFPNGSGRLDLACQIGATDNPLTARVWVNRVWLHHFGEPLVENPSDFGLRTKRPVHSELLDYLAAFFVENDWRTKPLHELIMSSQAWQRSSQLPGDTFAHQAESDPNNQLIWRANRRRLDFEQMRDTVLAISGQLDAKMFGRPPVITDANNHRRTVYAFVERQNVPSIVQTFDFANADSSTARCVTTTVPQQALFAMNSAFMTAAAKSLAKRAGDDVASRIEKLYAFVYGRLPLNDELELANEFLKTNSVEQFAQVLLMSNELMFVD